PWPQAANGTGAAVQLLDATQDNSRAGNWASSTEWRFASATGIANTSRLYVYLNGIGDLFIDDIMVVSGTVAGAGINLVRDGDFETPLAGNWVLPPLNGSSHLSTTNIHNGSGSFHLVSTNATVALPTINYQDMSPGVVTGATYTVSYWYRPKASTPNLTIRISSGTMNSTHATGPLTATPGVVNSTVTPLPPFPNLWLNEVQPLNTTGIVDNLGEREPWVEIYNPGTNGVSLDGLYLSDNYTNLAQWAFPSNLTINAGQFKIVYLDGEPGESTLTDWHTSFRLNGSTGSVIISRLLFGSSQVVDYLNFQNITNDRSYGSFPDGQPFFRQPLFNATPGGTNNAASPPLFVFINEWMAANNGVIRDPADNDAEDWFELY